MMTDYYEYQKDKTCDICKSSPAKLIPHFYYYTCLEHYKLTPLEFSKLKVERC